MDVILLDTTFWARSGRASRWAGLERLIDQERYAEVAPAAGAQERVALWQRRASLPYFQQFARKPMPRQYERPARPLELFTALTRDRIPDFRRT